jgi:outer membrane lipoprotein-sorting protein
MPTASEILDQVHAVYRGCTSYADTGEVRSVFSRTGHTSALQFSTSFVRPDRFRFEYGQDTYGPQRYVIWSSGSETRSRWTLRPEVETGRALFMALGAAAGVSQGASSRIPELLMFDGKKLPFDELQRRDRTDGVDCYVLRRNRESGSQVFWIAADTYLIRRVQEEYTIRRDPLVRGRRIIERQLSSPATVEEHKRFFRKILERWERPDTHVEMTTVYRPLLDVAIGDDRFAFDPPFHGTQR